MVRWRTAALGHEKGKEKEKEEKRGEGKGKNDEEKRGHSRVVVCLYASRATRRETASGKVLEKGEGRKRGSGLKMKRGKERGDEERKKKRAGSADRRRIKGPRCRRIREAPFGL